MKYIILAALFILISTVQVQSQPAQHQQLLPSECDTNPDWYTLETHPTELGAYLYTYHNSKDMCSGEFLHHNVMSDDENLRIFVRVEVSIDEEARERVTVYRVPEGWFAWPESVLIIEGGTDSITIYPPTPVS